MKKILKYFVSKFFLIFNYKIFAPDFYVKDQIEEINKDENEFIKISLKYSNTNKIRMWSLIQSLKHVKKLNLDGDLVECGVYKGGNLILMDKISQSLKLNKKIYGYDTFEGMVAPSIHDKKFYGKSGLDIFKEKKESKIPWMESSIDEVKTNISRYCNLSQFRLIKGKVEDTLLDINNLPEKISILRLDTDFYESTKIELEILYPRIVKYGILIIDDYGSWTGCRKAVDEYFNNQNNLILIDHGCRMMIKF